MQKWNLREKLGKEHLNCKSQLWQKVNGQSQRWSTVSQHPGQRWCQLMTWRWWRHLGLTSARGTWRVTVWRCVKDLGGVWRRVERVSSCIESYSGAWGCVAASMMVRFPQEGRSAEKDLSGTCKNIIGARITVATLWQWSRDYEWRRLHVRNQRRWLKRIRGLTANGYSNSCKGGSNCESKIILMKTWLPRKSQSDGSDTMLEILEDCIVFLNERIYISALYIGDISVQYK